MIGDMKLTKLSDELYSEPYKEGKDFKWGKHPERLYMDVFNISRRTFSSVDDPRGSLIAEKYKEERGEILEGIGVFQDRSIHLIDAEGSIGPSVDKVEFCIRPYNPKEDEKIPASSMWWRDEEEVRWSGRRDPHLFMEILVSSKIYKGIVTDIERKSFESISMGVFVEVFQSEVERGLAEPWMHQDYCIVGGSMAKTYFELFSVTDPSTSPNGKSLRKEDTDSLDDEDDWLEPEKEAEPLEEIRDLFFEYTKNSIHLLRQARSIKIALWCVFVILTLLLLAVIN